VRFPGGIVGSIATITINTQESIIGDFYGNGISDILWQNIDGQVAIWQMNGTTPIAGKLAGTNPGRVGTSSPPGISTATATPTFFFRTRAERFPFGK
jgi:hypothetical protein